MTRLTLSVDEDVVRRAREYARRHRTSVSHVVNAFLGGLAESDAAADPLVIRRLMGILPESADESDYTAFLEEKYRG